VAQQRSIEESGGSPRGHLSPVAAAYGTGVALLAAGFAVFIALVADVVLSTEEVGSHGTPLLTAQLAVALIGLIPTGLFAWALRRNDPKAVVWFVIGIVTYLGWGVLNDAAVHGWDHLAVF
jgi:hypothetical protein